MIQQVTYLTGIRQKQLDVYNYLINQFTEELNVMRLTDQIDYDVDVDMTAKIAVANTIIDMWPHEVGLIEFAKKRANLPGSITTCN